MEYTRVGDLTPIRCKKCGKNLAVEKTEILGLVPGDGLSVSQLKYRLTIVCPEQGKYLGLAPWSHDKKLFNEDCSIELT